MPFFVNHANIGIVLFELKFTKYIVDTSFLFLTALNLEPQEVVDANPPDPVGNRQGNHYGETEDKDVRQYLGSGNFKLISLGHAS